MIIIIKRETQDNVTPCFNLVGYYVFNIKEYRCNFQLYLKHTEYASINSCMSILHEEISYLCEKDVAFGKLVEIAFQQPYTVSSPLTT